MTITLLCNAGLAMEQDGRILLIDLPNEVLEPFYSLPDAVWTQILEKKPPYDRVCGLYFTHEHPDHCDRARVDAYLRRYPDTPCFFPADHAESGCVCMGPFSMEFTRVPHAPLPELPVHVVTMVSAGGKSIYLPADSTLRCEYHRAFLRGRKADAAVWNPMFLSRPDARVLMAEAADKSYIYHMPSRPDPYGYWKKLELNFLRFGEELRSVTVWEHYPDFAIL